VTALRLAVSRSGGSRFEVDVAPGARIGSSASADVRFPDATIEPEQARLEQHDGRWFLVATAPGVFVAGAELHTGARAAVSPGTEIQIGPYRVVTGDATPDRVPSAERTASLARELVRELLSGPGGAAPELVCDDGPAAGDRLRLPPPESRVVVGRGEGSSWVILDPNLSRAHAAIDRGWDGTRVIDLGSKNGTRVAGELAPTVTPGRALADGDIVELGATKLRYVDPAEQYLRDLDARLAVATPEAPLPAIPAPPPVRRRRKASLVPILVAAVIALVSISLLVMLLS
jgi:pSer/pThr/pTyr-binding forkhead associated (FHA) protein